MKYLEMKGISKELFYRNTQISASNFKRLGMRSDLGGDKIAKILTIYNDINAEWLLTGEGEIFKTKTPQNVPKSKGDIFGDKLGDKRKLRKTSPNNTSYTQPSVPVDPAAEPTAAYGTQSPAPVTNIFTGYSDEQIQEWLVEYAKRFVLERYQKGEAYPAAIVEKMVEKYQKQLADAQQLIGELRARLGAGPVSESSVGHQGDDAKK